LWAITTELGRLPLRQELPDKIKMKVMVRPDFIDIRPATDGAGVIVDRVFQGINYLYRVQLPSGATIQCQQHHNHAYSVNTRVTIKINPGHNIAYFVNRAES
jgi:ABC-type Fe3+/spermidine/putrescine transport system ATPase subunit